MADNSSIGGYFDGVRGARPILDADDPVEFARLKRAPAPVPGVSSEQVKGLADKFRSTLEAAKLKIVEQQDLIEQIAGGPKLYGMTLQVFPATFAPEEFYTDKDGKKVGVDVRVLKGPFAGRMGKIASEINRDGEAFVQFPFDKVKQKFQLVRKNENPPLKVRAGTEFERVLANPGPGEFLIGSLVEWGGEWRAVVGAVDPSGMIRVMIGDDIEEVFVGRDELVVPSGKTAGVAYVLIEGRVVEMKLPREGTLRRGDMVAVSPQTFEIISIGGMPSFGETVFFECLSDDGLYEVTVGSQQTTKLIYSVLPDDTELKKGDRIALDMTNSVGLRVLPREMKIANSVVSTGVSWDDIGGQEEAKQVVREAIEHPVIHAEMYRAYGKRPTKGVLLYGPPGTGKTMIGKAAVSSLAEFHGAQAAAESFIYVKGPEVLSQWVGAAEAHIRRLFEQARMHKAEKGFPAVIFIDEADAILGKRGSMRSSDVDKTIVPMFLSEMDGLDDAGAMMLLATNRPDALDPAVTREGRIDRKVKVGRPNQDACRSIFTIYLAKTLLAGKEKAETLAAYAAAHLMDMGHGVLDVEFASGGTETLRLSDLVSGAMVAGIVDKATTFAMTRDIASGKRSGVGQADIRAAVALTLKENSDMNHDDDVKEIAGARPIKRLTPIISWNLEGVPA